MVVKVFLREKEGAEGRKHEAKSSQWITCSFGCMQDLCQLCCYSEVNSLIGLVKCRLRCTGGCALLFSYSTSLEMLTHLDLQAGSWTQTQTILRKFIIVLNASSWSATCADRHI